jgi:OmpA-OmpF porin, OOP family
MCQPRRWLWGLLPLALLWLAAGFLRHDSIQTDLTTRSVNDALKAKAPWASAIFNGRDATVTGVSPSPAVQKSAEDAVDSVFGVRRVENKTTVLAEQKPYIWTASREGNKVTLGGFAPDEATKAKIVADTKAALPNTDVVDQMKIARGVPAVFGAATAYSLAQLARLPDGKASLSDAALAITRRRLTSIRSPQLRVCRKVWAAMSRLVCPPSAPTHGRRRRQLRRSR